MTRTDLTPAAARIIETLKSGGSLFIPVGDERGYSLFNRSGSEKTIVRFATVSGMGDLLEAHGDFELRLISEAPAADPMTPSERAQFDARTARAEAADELIRDLHAEQRAQALTIECPGCGAPAGEHCTTASGDTATRSHRRRFNRANAAKLITVDEPETTTDTDTDEAPAANHDRLVVFNMGLGRDSITMLLLAIDGNLMIEGKRCGIDEIDVVVFSDTGAEWPYTYALIPRIERLAELHGFRFIVLAKPPKDGPNGWMTNPRPRGCRELPAWVKATEGMTIEDKAAAGGFHLRLPIMAEYMRFGKIAITASGACTANHKVGAIRRFTDALCRERFGVGTRSWGANVRNGSRRPHIMLLGFAADEGTRQAKESRPAYEVGGYPLIEAGINKDDEQPILVAGGFGDVLKSGCIMCPFARMGTFWALRELHPALFAQVVEYEAAALAVNSKMQLKKGGDITERVESWRQRNPDQTIEFVLSKGFSMCAKPAAADAAEMAKPAPAPQPKPEPTTAAPEPFDADAALWAMMSRDARIAQLAGSVRNSRRALKHTDDTKLIAAAAAIATSRETRRQLDSRLRRLGWTAQAAADIDALYADANHTHPTTCRRERRPVDVGAHRQAVAAFVAALRIAHPGIEWRAYDAGVLSYVQMMAEAGLGWDPSNDDTDDAPEPGPTCPHCGEEIEIDALHMANADVIADWLPCCQDARDHVELWGWADFAGQTVAETLNDSTGLDVHRVDTNGVSDSLCLWSLEIFAPGLGVKGWQADVFEAIDLHHRHHDAPQGWKFGVAVYNGPKRVGVAVVGRPVSRMLAKAQPDTLEVTRVCTWGDARQRRNAASKLYGAAVREARKLGATKLITYTIADVEDGASLKASGFHVELERTKGGSWSRDDRPRDDKAPTGAKVRWARYLDKRRHAAQQRQAAA